MSVPQDLRNLYIRSAPEKLDNLERLWAAAETGYWQPAAITPLRDFAHRLAGSGGSYGFTDLGDIARALELSIPAGGGSTIDTVKVKGNYEGLRKALRELAETATD